jgi:hypothetical protein
VRLPAQSRRSDGETAGHLRDEDQRPGDRPLDGRSVRGDGGRPDDLLQARNRPLPGVRGNRAAAGVTDSSPHHLRCAQVTGGERRGSRSRSPPRHQDTKREPNRRGKGGEGRTRGATSRHLAVTHYSSPPFSHSLSFPSWCLGVLVSWWCKCRSGSVILCVLCVFAVNFPGGLNEHR